MLALPLSDGLDGRQDFFDDGGWVQDQSDSLVSQLGRAGEALHFAQTRSRGLMTMSC